MIRPGPADTVHLVVPHTLHDPLHPSGGNVYDRELAAGLRALGHRVSEHPVPGAWHGPGGSSESDLAQVLEALPVGATALVDGLVGLGAAHVLVPERHRLRLWLLVHLPLGYAADITSRARAQERLAFTAAAGVITTSDWTRTWLLATYGLKPARVRVARPGVHPAALSSGSPHGGALVCVGAVVPDKGHDVLLDALTNLTDLPWSCRVVGPLDRAPGFVDRLRTRVRRSGLSGRIRFTGALPPAGVSAAHDAADLLVLPTRLETYGMALTEALARGVPVVASDTGGVAEAVGTAPDGTVPGVLVPTGDAVALAAAVRRWLAEPAWRGQLRGRARARRGLLSDWSATAHSVHRALEDCRLNHSGPTDVVRT